MVLGFGVFGTAFWLFMLYDCIQSGQGKRGTWLWILVFLNFFGAVLYFFAEWLPNHQVPIPRFAGRWTRRREIHFAEAEARNINKAYQHIKLGTLLAEVHLFERAAEAFRTACTKEPENPQALWGLAKAEVACDRIDAARQALATLMDVDPDFRHGEGVLAYAEVLAAGDDWEKVRALLQGVIHKFSQPPVCLLLAEAEVYAGNSDAAREILEKMLMRVRGTYDFSYRRNLPSIRKAEKLLKRIERATSRQ